MMKSVEENTKATAPVVEPSELEKIRGLYIVRPTRRTWLSGMSGNKDGRDLHEGTYTRLCTELHPTSGVHITGLTKAQQVAFEEEMTLPAGTLSPYNDTYWSRFTIDIPTEGLILNCDRDIKNKLILCVLKASTKVANSLAEASLKSYTEFVISSTEVEKTAEANALKVRTMAYAKLATMSTQERMDYLKVFEEGKYSVNKSANADFIDAAIGNIIERSPKAFLEVFDNPYYKEAIFLKSCLEIKAVQKQGQKYYINGGEKIGDSYLNTLMNLASADYEEAKISLLGKIQAHNK